jgi:flagellar hook assembly protein FlgD
MSRHTAFKSFVLCTLLLPAASLHACPQPPCVFITDYSAYVDAGSEFAVTAEDWSGTYIYGWSWSGGGATRLSQSSGSGYYATSTATFTAGSGVYWISASAYNQYDLWDGSAVRVYAIDVTIDDHDSVISYQSSSGADIDFTMAPNDGSYRRHGWLYINGPSGAVKTVDLGETVGSRSYHWDGKKSDGTWAPPGSYTIDVVLYVGPSGSMTWSDSCEIDVVALGTVTQNKTTAAINQNVGFTAVTNPIGYESGIAWSAPGAATTSGSGGSFTTHWGTAGIDKQVSATYNGNSVYKYVTVVGLTDLTAADALEFDDGDSSTDRSYIVPVASSGVVTVTATTNPTNADVSSLDSWEFSGGDAVSAKVRTVSKTAPGRFPLKCKCGSQEKNIAVYVVGVSISGSFPAYVGVGNALRVNCTPTLTGGQYTWSQVDGTGSGTFEGPHDQNPNFRATAGGPCTIKVEYTIGGVTVSDTKGPVNVVTVSMSGSYPVYAEIGSAVRMGCTASIPGGQYAWSQTGGTGSGTFEYPSDPNLNFRATGPGPCTIKVEYTVGGITVSDTRDNAIIVVDLTIDSSFPAFIKGLGNSLQLNTTPLGFTGGSFAWTKCSGPGNVNISGGEDPIFSADQYGEYMLQVTYAGVVTKIIGPITVMDLTIDTPLPGFVRVNCPLELDTTIYGVTGGTYSWAKLSGPGNVMFSPSADYPSPAFGADQPGNYTIRLTYTMGGITVAQLTGDITVVDVSIGMYSEYIAYESDEGADFTFTAAPADLPVRSYTWLTIKDDQNTVVRIVPLGEVLGPGTAHWDGKMDDGETWAPAGMYTATIELHSGAWGSTIFSDSCTITVFDVSIGDHTDYWPHKSLAGADIEFETAPLSSPFRCAVSLIIADSEDAPIRTIYLGEALGLQIAQWDGKKDDGTWASPGAYTATIELSSLAWGSTVFSDSCTINVVGVDISAPSPFPAHIGVNSTLHLDCTPSIPDGQYTWEQAYGPGAGAFSDAHRKDPNFTATQPGTYVLRLLYTVHDLTVNDVEGTVIVGVGLGIDGMSQTDGYVAVNNDDDNNNGVTDGAETEMVANEDDLVPISLVVSGPNDGEARLEAIAGADKISLWTDSTKTTAVSLPSVWSLSSESVPAGLYVEGVSGSTSERDVSLRLSWAPEAGAEPVCSQTVTFTVADVTLQLGSDKKQFYVNPTEVVEVPITATCTQGYGIVTLNTSGWDPYWVSVSLDGGQTPLDFSSPCQWDLADPCQSVPSCVYVEFLHLGLNAMPLDLSLTWGPDSSSVLLTDTLSVTNVRLTFDLESSDLQVGVATGIDINIDPPGLTEGYVMISVLQGGDFVQFWQDAEMTEEWSPPFVWNLGQGETPSVVYAERKEGQEEEGGVTLQLSYVSGNP